MHKRNLYLNKIKKIIDKICHKNNYRHEASRGMDFSC